MDACSPLLEFQLAVKTPQGTSVLFSLFFFDGGGRHIRTRRILNFPSDMETSRCSKDVKLQPEVLVIVKAFRKNDAMPPPFAFSLGTWMTLKSFNVFKILANEMLFPLLFSQVSVMAKISNWFDEMMSHIKPNFF